MESVKIQISRKNDKEPILTEYQDDQLMAGKVEAVGILEAGMQSGRTSLMIFSKINGRTVALEISARNFIGVAGALRGAEERFL